MFRKILLMLICLAVLNDAHGLAQDDETPTIAIMRLGELAAVIVTENAILDTLQARGFINAEERAMMAERQDLLGENLNIIWGDAGYDFALVPVMINNALDQDADVLITTSTIVTQTAVNTTLDLDDPPAVLFTSVYAPYYAGIADAPCIKPDHVTGFQARVPYEEIVPMLLQHNPDLKTIGAIYHSASLSGAFGIESIQEAAEALGLVAETTAIASLSDLRAATLGLINKSVEAILLPADSNVAVGTPIIAGIALEYNIPVYFSTTGGVSLGATFGIGGYRHYKEGLDAGRVLAAYLKGDIDFADIGIGSISGIAIGMNVDLARAGDIEVSDEMMAMADMAVADNMIQISSKLLADYFGGMDPAAMPSILEAVASALPDVEFVDGKIHVPADKLNAIVESATVLLAASAGGSQDDTAFLESLHCSPEMIAEQQAALDAAAE